MRLEGNREELELKNVEGDGGDLFQDTLPFFSWGE
jgi:hypothetical protein